MKKKKLFAFLTALICAGSMSAISVSAEMTTAFVTLVGDEYFLDSNSCRMYQETFKKYSGLDFNLKYGDVFGIHGEYEINLTFPGRYAFEDDVTLEYLGTVSDVYETKELTVTEFGIGNGRIYMEDTENTSYYYNYYPKKSLEEIPLIGFAYPEEVNPDNFQIGDKILCAVDYDQYYGDYVVLPVEVTERSTVTLTGDANRDGKLDILDVILVNKVIFGKETLPDILLKQVDFNSNNMPDANDSLTMMKMIVGLI